jgi:hypothetical protein
MISIDEVKIRVSPRFIKAAQLIERLVERPVDPGAEISKHVCLTITSKRAAICATSGSTCSVLWTSPVDTEPWSGYIKAKFRDLRPSDFEPGSVLSLEGNDIEPESLQYAGFLHPAVRALEIGKVVESYKINPERPVGAICTIKEHQLDFILKLCRLFGGDRYEHLFQLGEKPRLYRWTRADITTVRLSKHGRPRQVLRTVTCAMR